jgi:predicted dehydrogenase
MEPLRVGVLGTARIAEAAIVVPAHATGTRLVAVAARDRTRAEAFAAEHGVEKALDSYPDVLADPEVEAIYNPLPNGLHAPWNLAAIAAGKHVLSEKPFAADADEAREVRDAGAGAGLVVAEAFHYVHHPVTRRLHELLASGELGELVQVETMMREPAPPADDPRWSLSLAGGALMDIGCYGLHAHRMLAPFAGGEPALISATGGERAGSPGVDQWVDAELGYPSGAQGRARCDMAGQSREMSCRIVGTRGEATATQFVLSHLDDRVLVSSPAGDRVEHLGTRSTYTYQLEAFVASIRNGSAFVSDSDDAVATMTLIDSCYAAIGLDRRPRSPRVA